MPIKIKRLLLSMFSIVFLSIGLSACSDKQPSTQESNSQATTTSSSKKELVIGYQKFGISLYLKENQILEKIFNKNNVSIKWVEFTSGPPMLEALNSGNLDIANTGEAPLIFAQAGNAKLVYFAYETPSPETEAIITHKNSPIKSVIELKSKKIAVTKGSSANYTLLSP